MILANTGIGILQEWRAKQTLDSLAVIGEARPTVRRDGTAAEIATDEIVLDDLIEIGPGDKVVVDGVCAEADGWRSTSPCSPARPTRWSSAPAIR